jgi:cytochrome c-type biogenesis protein CcmH
VLESSSELAREMQRLIREKLAAGESPEAVTEFFVSKYGEWVLLKPEPSGINLLVYILPLAVVVLAAGVLQGRIRSWVRAGTASRVAAFTVAPEGSPVTDAISVVENEQSDMPNVVPARISAENERWLEEALEE